MPGLRDENIPNFKLVQSDKGIGDVFISLGDIKCLGKIREIVNDNISIESYLNDFTKHSKTNYQEKKKCTEDKLGEVEKIVKPAKVKKIIVESDEPIVVENDKPIVFTELLRKWTKPFNYHPNDVLAYFRELIGK